MTPENWNTPIELLTQQGQVAMMHVMLVRLELVRMWRKPI